MNLFKREKIRRVPTVFQMEATECGAASLGMILAYHGYYEPLEKLRVACGVSRNGSKASLIMKAAVENYHMDSHGYRVSADKLTDLPLPCILFWEFNHYVVFEGRRGDTFYVNDPAAGKRQITREAFEKSYTGVALTFQPTAAFHRHGRRRGVFKTLFPLMWNVKSVAAILLWSGLLLILPGVLMPSLLQIFIDEVLGPKNLWLFPLILSYALAMLVSVILTWLTQVALRRGELQLTVNGTVKMLRHVLALPMTFFMQRFSADLQARIRMNSSVSVAFFNLVAGNAVKLFTASFFLFLLYQYSWILASVTLGTAILNFALLALVNRWRQNINQTLVSAETRMLNKTMTGIVLMEPFRASGHDRNFFSGWANSLAEYTNRRFEMQKSSTFFSATPELLFSLNNVLILCLGAWFVIKGDLTLGGMMAFQSLMASFIQPVNSLVNAGSQIQELKGTLDRIEDVMNYAPEQRFAPAGTLKVQRGELELKDVSFGYSRLEAPLIEHFSLKLPPGGRIALVGASGSGKSTIAKIASGLYPPWSGEILLDGHPVGEYSREEFNRAIATVDQSITLFSGDVGENLTLFKRKKDTGTLLSSLRDAAIERELAARGQPLTLPVEENGANFSGGQRQRLEIARALTRNAPILILDEATSALDPITEVMIDNAIRRRGASCLIVAHRLSTIRDCDEIIMLDHGKIMERGTHQELMAKHGTYAALMDSDQMRREA